MIFLDIDTTKQLIPSMPSTDNSSGSKMPSTVGLMGKLFAEATAFRSPKVSQRRINDLLTKTHICGSVTLPIPNLVAAHAMRQIEHLRQSDPLAWLMECLWLLAHQHNEDIFFLRGPERERAIAMHASKISSMDAPAYMVALLELHEAVAKKNANLANDLEARLKSLQEEISRLASSPLPKQQDTR